MSAGARTLIFLHIPRTGGTSLRALLLRSIGSRPSIKLMNQDHTPLLAMSGEARAGLGMVEGHMLYGMHEHIPGACTYITLLREPAARLRSWHRYVLQRERHRLHGVIAGRGLSLAECIERRVTPELDNDMTRTLASVGRAGVPIGGVTRTMFDAACERLASIEFVGTTERMDEFHAMLCERMGWAVAPMRRLNQTAAGNDGAGDEDPSLTRLLREINGFDLALWQRAGEILARRLGVEAGDGAARLPIRLSDGAC